MTKLKIERMGGFVGMGGNSRLRSRGEIDMTKLSNEEKQTVEALFVSKSKPESSLARDTFQYKITRKTSKGVETIIANEENIPAIVKQCVKDEII